LLRKYKLAGQDKNQVCQQETQKRVEPSGTRLVGRARDANTNAKRRAN
jgi:hypothetical protein